MKTWSDGVLESFSIGSLRIKALQYSSTVKFRFTLYFLVWAMLFALCVSAETQQSKRIPRIGYLSSFDPASDSERAEGIWLGLRELGYIIASEYRYADGKLDCFSELAAELVRLKVDMIVVAGGNRTVRAVMNVTQTIPIVIAGIPADPVEAGLIESLARPGGNVTGLISLSRELAGKRLELLKEAVPKIARVAVLYDPAIQLSLREAKEALPAAARLLGLTVRSWDVRAPDDFDRVFTALDKQPADGLYISGSALMINHQKRTAGFALKRRLPSMYGIREAVDVGGLMSYAADQTDIYRRVADLYRQDRQRRETR